jgi:Domain of unknown function (DUF5666)
MTTTQKAVAIPALALMALLGGAYMGYAQLSQAATDTNVTVRGGMMGMHGGGKPGVHGEITAINGTTLTVKGMNSETYTVDASDAEIRVFTEGEGLDDASVSDLRVGDTVGVRGSIDGTNVDASDIMSGIPEGRMGGRGHHGKHGVMGEVTAVDGSTITVTGLNGTSYTIDASDAPVSRVVEGSLSDIKVGDRIGVQGSIDGATVDAKRIMDDVPEKGEMGN